MNFFQDQDHARRQTTLLLVLFALAVALIILAVYVAIVAAGMHTPVTDDGVGFGSRTHPLIEGWWHPQVLLWVALGTSIVVGLASLAKTLELAAGGEAIALMLGGRPVNPQMASIAEKRLLNVVEEMALASGVPVPPVYVLTNEPSINAFAAGHQAGDAVIAVSRGALEYLTRDELQGVVGHEFSHILNGDMRLNLRLMGVVYGILFLSSCGYDLMRFARFADSDDNKRVSPGLLLFLLGLALYVIGYLGVILGSIIKAAISRQREYLADASSVQFTRNPASLAGALKKIAALSEGSTIRNGRAAEISHMFFSEATSPFFGLLATHPPLMDRILRLDLSFDGSLPDIQPLEDGASFGETGLPGTSGETGLPSVEAMSLASGGPQRAVEAHVGRPQAAHLAEASRAIASLPLSLADAAREPFTARAVVYTLLLSQTAASRARQLDWLAANIEPPLFEAVRHYLPEADRVPATSRLPLVNLTTAALKRLSPGQYGEFRSAVESLVSADQSVDLFEYCLCIVLFSYLDVFFRRRRAPQVRYKSPASIAGAARVVFSTLAHAGNSDAVEAQAAFHAGVKEAVGTSGALLPQAECKLKAFDAALWQLAETTPSLKRAVLSGAAACIKADGVATVEELELLRAIAAALACPMPIAFADALER